MAMLKLVDVLAIESPERERLVEIDDAIRDLVRAVEAEAQSQGLDQPTLARATVGVLVAAAARQAVAVYPGLSEADLGEGLASLATEAVVWASGRVLGSKRGAQEAGGEAGRAALRSNRGSKRPI